MENGETTERERGKEKGELRDDRGGNGEKGGSATRPLSIASPHCYIDYLVPQLPQLLHYRLVLTTVFNWDNYSTNVISTLK